MPTTLPKVLRTVEVNFPRLVDAKYAAVRGYCRLRGRPFERDFDALRGFPSIGGLYLDVGANRGQSTDAIRLCRPEATVVMFEPNRLLAARLEERFGAAPRMTVHPFGLAEATSEADLFVPFYKGWMFDGWASLEEQNASLWMPDHFYRFDPRHVRVERTTCALQRLDDLGLEPFFIKIDVQGFELSVLEGGRDTLVRSEPVLLIEAGGPSEVSRYLTELGYVPYRWDGEHLRAEEYGWLNTFFVGPGKQDLLRRTSPGLLMS